MEIKFRGDGVDVDYEASSDNKELMDDLYNFLIFDIKRHKDCGIMPLYTERNGFYYIFMTREHVERILTTYSHH